MVCFECLLNLMIGHKAKAIILIHRRQNVVDNANSGKKVTFETAQRICRPTHTLIQTAFKRGEGVF